MGSGFYCELFKRLRGAGCHPTRQGKGSHEIWLNPKTGLSFSVPVTVKSRHTANEILKQAGLPRDF